MPRLNNEFSATFLAQLRQIERHQERRRGELEYDLLAAKERVQALKAELAETERGVAESRALLEKFGGEEGDE
ncbi:hypothetical protein [Thalassobacillus sp. CUG 92003]|uniref:hypothetical protein n=1 Tax=Thalassobacillus sp. CUG 92003 TaxID=2736641 RepID=UPI0015E6C825|nr:hypothetical protein [Thalassobacillus sp. CUG 92003]